MHVDEENGVGTFYAGADSLGESANFIGGGVTPSVLVLGMLDELAVFQCFPTGLIKDTKSTVQFWDG